MARGKELRPGPRRISEATKPPKAGKRLYLVKKGRPKKNRPRFGGRRGRLWAQKTPLRYVFNFLAGGGGGDT